MQSLLDLTLVMLLPKHNRSDMVAVLGPFEALPYYIHTYIVMLCEHARKCCNRQSKNIGRLGFFYLVMNINIKVDSFRWNLPCLDDFKVAQILDSDVQYVPRRSAEG
jgi:hypothetical protein